MKLQVAKWGNSLAVRLPEGVREVGANLLTPLLPARAAGVAGAPATDCALERWRDAGSKEGEVARDRLAVQAKSRTLSAL